MLDTDKIAESRPAHWSHAMKSQDSFWREQAEIGKVWQLVGLTTSVERDKDWFRSTLGGRSVFVQRFADAIRGFEKCACTAAIRADRGPGQRTCALWLPPLAVRPGRTAVGTQVQGDVWRSPSDIVPGCGRRGGHVRRPGFARFRGSVPRSLEEYLGPGFPILKAMSVVGRSPYVRATSQSELEARPQISLDDYHRRRTPDDVRQARIPALDARPVPPVRPPSAYFYNADEQASRFG